MEQRPDGQVVAIGGTDRTENSQYDWRGLVRGIPCWARADNCCHVTEVWRRSGGNLARLAPHQQNQEAEGCQGEGMSPLRVEEIGIGETWALDIGCGSVGAENLVGHLDLGHDRGRAHEHAVALERQHD